MARMADRRKEEFNADREFSTIRRMRFAGVDYTPGQDFPKHLCNSRRLRVLYEQGWIDMRGMNEPPYRSPTAKFDAMSLEELRNWLVNHGAVPRMTWDRGKLLEKAASVDELS